LGYAYHEQGRMDDAQEEYEEALDLNPYYALSMYNLGLVYYKKGLLDEVDSIIIKKRLNWIQPFQIPFTTLVSPIIRRDFIGSG